MAKSRFESLDNSAPVQMSAENEKPKVKYSKFDLTKKKIGQANPFAIIPIDTIPTLPNSDFWLNYDLQVSFRNPTHRKMLNGWRVYLRAYYNRYSDLWEGWNNFITRGRTGTMNLKIPHIKTRLQFESGNIKTPFTPMSLYDYLGWKSEKYRDLSKYTGNEPARINPITGDPATKTNLADYSNIQISALKPVMYQRLWRDKYCPKNLLQGNTKLFPANEDHFILSYSANEVDVIDYGNENQQNLQINSDIHGNGRWIENIVGLGTEVRIDTLRYRQWQGDRFTVASPFEDMLRGDKPVAELEVDGSGRSLQLTDGLIYAEYTNDQFLPIDGIGTSGPIRKIGTDNAEQWTTGAKVIAKEGTGGTYALIAPNGTYNNENLEGFVVKSSGIQLPRTTDIGLAKLYLDQIRTLDVFTTFAERMARTNGDYNDMIKAQFGYNPKTPNKEAYYIGGSYQDIIQTSIYQTSESTDESPLGTQVAQGISTSYNKLGHFHADDYGEIMVVMCIVPETLYTNGINKHDTSLNMEEQYFPIFNNLSAEPILNKELAVTGDEDIDNDVWAWSERFENWKERRNDVCGFSELNSTQSAYDSALVMARRFGIDTPPQFNAEFVTGYPGSVDTSVFTANDEPPFDFALLADVEANYPIPYTTVPQSLMES